MKNLSWSSSRKGSRHTQEARFSNGINQDNLIWVNTLIVLHIGHMRVFIFIRQTRVQEFLTLVALVVLDHVGSTGLLVIECFIGRKSA
jgi:hypothetical protein